MKVVVHRNDQSCRTTPKLIRLKHVFSALGISWTEESISACRTHEWHGETHGNTALWNIHEVPKEQRSKFGATHQRHCLLHTAFNSPNHNEATLGPSCRACMSLSVYGKDFQSMNVVVRLWNFRTFVPLTLSTKYHKHSEKK